ncbi:MAG: flagellar hook-basal body complex protein FliE [Rickettsiales bacterium]
MNVTNANVSSAMSAYNNALKVADRILSQTSIAQPEPQKPISGPSFSELVGGALKSAAASGYTSEATSTKALAGKADITDVVTAVANAEMALNTVVAVRDRVISAYQDIIKMPI